MTLNEMVVAKVATGGVMATSGVVVALASATSNIPIELGALLVMLGAAVTYGKLLGEAKERKEINQRLFHVIHSEQAWSRIAITRIAESVGVKLSDIPQPEKE
jgi:hypothetical protein